MLIDTDDLRSEIRSFAQEAAEELVEEDDPYVALVAYHFGKLEGYKKVEQMLDEQEDGYRKQGVDWDNVPVDTLVRVRDGEYEKWRLRYFAGFFEYDSLKYATWNSGRTSKTANEADDFTCWRYCELVEDEEDEE